MLGFSVSPFGSFFVFRFPSNTCLIRQYTWFLSQVLSLLSSPYGIVCTVRKWGRMGLNGWLGGVLGFGQELNLARDLIGQPDSWLWVPLRISVPKGTRELISVDHTWIRSHNRNSNSTVYPLLYVWIEFVHFSFHNSNQLKKYDQVFSP